MKTELHVPSDLKFLSVVEAWMLESLGTELRELDSWKTLAPKLRLALVEAYSNVVRHAHKEKPYIPVVLRLEVAQNAIALEIWDSGAGYDTAQYEIPHPGDFQEGGYGWMILSQLMDTVEYVLQARDGQNCLKLEISVPTLKDNYYPDSD